MSIQYACNGVAHHITCEGGFGDAHTNGQNLDGEDADVGVLRSELAEERDVGQQTDADAMDK